MTSSSTDPINPVEAHNPAPDAAIVASAQATHRPTEPLVVDDVSVDTPRTTQQSAITVNHDVEATPTNFDLQVNVEEDIHDAAVHGSAIAQAIEQSDHSGVQLSVNDLGRQLGGAAGVAASGVASPRRTELVDGEHDREDTDGVKPRDSARAVGRPTDPA